MLDTFLHHFLKNLDVLVFLQVPPSPPTSFCSVAGCCHHVIAGVWGAGLGGLFASASVLDSEIGQAVGRKAEELCTLHQDQMKSWKSTCVENMFCCGRRV